MPYEIEPHLPFHLAAKLEWLYSRRYRLYQHLAMLQRVLPTTGLHHFREPAVSKVFSQGTLLHEHPVVYRHACIHLQHTEDLAAKIYITRLLRINSSKTFRALSLAPARRDRSRACDHRTRQQSSLVLPNLPARLLAITLSPPSSLATCICCSYSK